MMEGKNVFALVVVVVAVISAGQTYASTPNTYWTCMRDCPGYNCYNPQRSAADCYAYCAIACAIPPTLAADHADHYCKLGCTTSKCITLPSNSGAHGLEGCIHTCSDICSPKGRNAVLGF